MAEFNLEMAMRNIAVITKIGKQIDELHSERDAKRYEKNVRHDPKIQAKITEIENVIREKITQFDEAYEKYKQDM